MSSFSTSLSGLNAQQQALSVISNDLANLNTTAFKTQTPIFSDLFYQMIGSNGAGDPVQVGVGATMSSISAPFTQGNISTTGVPTDVAIEQNGLFVLDNGGTQVYTRAGNFTLNPHGFLVDSGGSNVMGYPAVNGVISTSQPIAPLAISSGQVYPPNATSDIQLDMNLDAMSPSPLPAAGTLSMTSNASDTETATIGGITYTFVTALSAGPTVPNEVLIGATTADTMNNLAAAIDGGTVGGIGIGTIFSTGTSASTEVTATANGDTVDLQAIANGTVGNALATTTTSASGSFASGTLTGGTPGGAFSTSITVYDSLGGYHVLTFNFSKTSSGDWDYQITIPATDVGTVGNPQVVGSGSMHFDAAGTLTVPGADVTGITVTGLADGSNPLSLTWQLFGTDGTPHITQTAEPSTTSAKQQNGYGAGTLSSYSIDSSGIINGVLSNGQTVSLGQFALATFPSYEGLSRVGSNNYQAGLASGLPSVGTPGTGGRGTLDGRSLEQSNVDIASEFTQLIMAERGYQANAKAITTADTLMQAAINLKQ